MQLAEVVRCSELATVMNFQRANVIFKDINKPMKFDQYGEVIPTPDLFMYFSVYGSCMHEQMIEGMTSRVIEERKSLYFSKGCYDARFHYLIDNPLNLPQVDNMLCVPLFYKSPSATGDGELLGVLQLFNHVHRGNSIFQDDEVLTQAVAGMLAGVLHVTNQLNAAFVVIYEFKTHIDSLTSHAKEG